jgi:sulfate-transporting ATPase
MNWSLTLIVQEYEADKKKRLGEEGAKPKRIRYKPISR